MILFFNRNIAIIFLCNSKVTEPDIPVNVKDTALQKKNNINMDLLY